MNWLKNKVSFFYFTETAIHSITRLCLLMDDYPFMFKPMRGSNTFLKNNNLIPKIPFHSDRTPLFYKRGLYFFPTVEKTTLFYDDKSDLFIKIIHPLTFKNKILSLFTNKAKSIYHLSEKLLSKGIKVPKIVAYGMLKKGRSFFYIMERVEGESLHSVLITKKESFPFDVYLNIVDKLAEIHKYGYWYGDLRLSHIFVKNGEISGFVDIDSIKKNTLVRLRNLAKDLAGLNRPDLPLSLNEKQVLFRHYVKKLGTKKEEHLLKLIKYYTERRWNS